MQIFFFSLQSNHKISSKNEQTELKPSEIFNIFLILMRLLFILIMEKGHSGSGQWEIANCVTAPDCTREIHAVRGI